MEREQTERRLHDSRTAANDADAAAIDSPMQRGMRTQYTAVTVASYVIPSGTPRGISDA